MVVDSKYLHSDLTDKIIKAATQVHRSLGPGLVERLHQRALKIELDNRKIKSVREKQIDMWYQGKNIGYDKVDFDVEGKVLVELKAVGELSAIHKAQMISYLKSSGYKVGLVINFARLSLQIQRVIN